jgi:hypothetical protein
MNTPSSPEPLDVMPMPPGAIELGELPLAFAHEERLLAVAALKQAMDDRNLDLPFGPTIEPEDPARLLSLNRFSVQLATTGITSDEVFIQRSFWEDSALAPQLLLAAAVDEENNVVYFPGVLTGEELLAQAKNADSDSAALVLDTACFKGGIDRLLTLVQLLEPAALPRLALPADPITALQKTVVSVLDWLNGQLDESLAALGGGLVPVTAGATRSGVGLPPVEGALAMVSIPLGLADGSLVTGLAAQRCLERFDLSLIPIHPDGLYLRLAPALIGDLLPDGLTLIARQGEHIQSITSENSDNLDLSFPSSSELLAVSVAFGSSEPIELPLLQLPKS